MVQTSSFFDPEKVSQNLLNAQVPQDLSEIILSKVARLSKGAPFTDIELMEEYVDWIVNLPWDKKTDDTLDLTNARKILDSNHYGLTEIKERILEYISVMQLVRGKAPQELRAPILCFVGLVGTGKTTIASSIAQALGRKFVRIAFGGLGDPGMLRGEARFRQGGEPGQVVKALRRAGVRNPVILLDEIDRIDERARGTIMGVLVELLDPEQNRAFVDAYLDYPFDLSEVLFIATANNTTNIAIAVLDRLEVLPMPSYTDSEKITIGRDFILPKTLASSGIEKEQIKIDESVWPLIVRPLGYDAGMRTLERTIQGVVRKIAKMIIEGRGTAFQLNETNMKDYITSW